MLIGSLTLFWCADTDWWTLVIVGKLTCFYLSEPPKILSGTHPGLDPKKFANPCKLRNNKKSCKTAYSISWDESWTIRRPLKNGDLRPVYRRQFISLVLLLIACCDLTSLPSHCQHLPHWVPRQHRRLLRFPHHRVCQWLPLVNQQFNTTKQLLAYNMELIFSDSSALSLLIVLFLATDDLPLTCSYFLCEFAFFCFTN